MEAAGYVALVVCLGSGIVGIPLAPLLALAAALCVMQSIAAGALGQLALRRDARLRDVALLLSVVENLGDRQPTVL